MRQEQTADDQVALAALRLVIENWASTAAHAIAHSHSRPSDHAYAPADEAVVDRLVRAVILRRVAPAQSVLDDECDGADDAPMEVGGEALVAPFHNTQLPVLKNMTIDLSAMHSIGQASLFPVSAGSASV